MASIVVAQVTRTIAAAFALQSALQFSFLVGLARPVSAANFLGGGNVSEKTPMVLTSGLLADIEDAMGEEHRRGTEGRLASLEATMRPIFVAMPKNAHGNLGHAAVRYVLHRLFVQKHGWYVNGISSDGESFNTSSPTRMLGFVPDIIQNLFENRIGELGMDLHEIAVLAATLEHLVHNESLERLRAAYQAQNRSLDGLADEMEADKLIDIYMASYIWGRIFTASSPPTARSWPRIQSWLREVRRETSRADEYSFQEITQVVEKIADRYGRYQNQECVDLKAQLIKLEERGTGRVSLFDFYSSAVHDGQWQFSESIDYLRELGALDEAEPLNPRVIIANYLYAPSNCLASSSFYSVCCINECDDLFGHLERETGASEAEPARLATLVAALPSASVLGNRGLPSVLRRRLDEIAAVHHGRVPLHGRLFAQWMHHAYPRECPFPHISGTTKPKRSKAWQASTGKSATLKGAALANQLDILVRPPSSSGETDIDGDECTAWSHHEELLAHRVEEPALSGWLSFGLLRAVVCLALLSAAGSTIFGHIRALKAGASMVFYEDPTKIYV